MTKECTLCGMTKPLEEFNRDKRRNDGRGSHCSECHNHRSAIYYRRSLGRYNEVRRRYRAGVRDAVLKKYGGCCACCGETTPQFLGIDHIDGGGKVDRDVGPGYAFYLRLYKSPRRIDLQVLCHNCNFAKGMYGQCPHSSNEASHMTWNTATPASTSP